mmetsp:Transcript_31838/g.83773  ORF Transcript_31838/g.83773 Transcript_31838/m.83773 type:complete len:284 (+) Transcript_31838:193-1044(+)
MCPQGSSAAGSQGPHNPGARLYICTLWLPSSQKFHQWPIISQSVPSRLSNLTSTRFSVLSHKSTLYRLLKEPQFSMIIRGQPASNFRSKPFDLPGCTLNSPRTQATGWPSSSAARSSRVYLPTKSISGSLLKEKRNVCWPAGMAHPPAASSLPATPRCSQSGSEKTRARVKAVAATCLKCCATDNFCGLSMFTFARTVPPLSSRARVPLTITARALASTLMCLIARASSVPPQVHVRMPPPSATSCSIVAVSEPEAREFMKPFIHCAEAPPSEAPVSATRRNL